MKVAKEYTFKSKGVVIEILFTIAQFALLLLLVIKLFKEPLILVLVGILPMILLLFQL
jgi:hypothetical protein